MRVERLEISAIGPYAGREVIEFGELNDAGVCLLTGPTGAGKSTILDAITFALYGTVPRDTKGEDLVSHLRKVEQKPEVVLEATIAGRALKICRSPEHLRPAARGEGTANQGQTVLVEELDQKTGEWQQRSDRWSEANDFLEDLIGMTDDQFSQVVLLPQGKFAEFLNAEPSARHELMSTLFPGVDLDVLEAWFEERAKADAAARGEKEAEITKSLTRVEPVLGRLREADPDLPERPEAILESGPVTEWMRAIEAVLSSRKAAAAKASEGSQETARQDEKTLREAESRKQKVERRKECEGKIAALEERSGWRSDGQAELEAGREATLVMDKVATVKELEAKAESEKAELERVSQAMEGLALDPDLDTDRLDELETVITGTLATIADFEKETRSGLDALVRERTKLEQEAESLEAGTSPALQKAEDDFVRLEAALNDKKRHLIEVRDLRTRGMAYELADQLEEGAPCMVCGSTEHPSPAMPEEHWADREDEEKASTAVEAAEKLLEGARHTRETARTDVEAKKARTASRIATLKSEISAIENKEAELRGDEPTLSARRDLLDRHRTAIRDFRSANSAFEATQEELAKAKVTVDTALAESGFKSAEQARQAARTKDQLEALEKSITDYDDQLSQAKGLLEGELTDVDPEENIDLEPLKTAAAKAGAARDLDLQALQQAKTDEEDFTSNAGRVPQMYEELAPLRKAADRSGELFLQTSGKSDSKLRLSTFVLAERLRKVIQAANHHLATMSSGKYEIRFDASSTGRKGSAGLGLAIYDFHSSRDRKPSTLSGGESFYTSLALALGLAEVVQAESGGRPLETLFIDEGFGSLDADTLDQVMDVIDSMRDGGRTVGLVSHVEEMKSRIPTRIVISASPRGSSLAVETGV